MTDIEMVARLIVFNDMQGHQANRKLGSKIIELLNQEYEKTNPQFAAALDNLKDIAQNVIGRYQCSRKFTLCILANEEVLKKLKAGDYSNECFE